MVSAPEALGFGTGLARGKLLQAGGLGVAPRLLRRVQLHLPRAHPLHRRLRLARAVPCHLRSGAIDALSRSTSAHSSARGPAFDCCYGYDMHSKHPASSACCVISPPGAPRRCPRGRTGRAPAAARGDPAGRAAPRAPCLCSTRRLRAVHSRRLERERRTGSIRPSTTALSLCEDCLTPLLPPGQETI